MIYLDGKDITADSFEELRAIAAKLKIEEQHFHGTRTGPYYDLPRHARKSVAALVAAKKIREVDEKTFDAKTKLLVAKKQTKPVAKKSK